MSVAVGSLVALFLWLLEKVTVLRWQNTWLLFLLPLAGVVIHFLYRLWGRRSEAGNNLIMDEIHEPGGGVPLGMAPLVLVTTVLTHLFGGSAGREGTAVQIGGSLAGFFARLFRLSPAEVKVFLMAGIAAGFGAVFGTPVTGAIFAMEVLVSGRIVFRALMPCLLAAVIGHLTCVGWGIVHTSYHINYHPANLNFFPVDVHVLCSVLLGGICFGLASWLFANLSHGIKRVSNRFIPVKWMIPVVGGVLIIVLTFLLGTRDYLGLGVNSDHPAGISIVSAFRLNGADPLSWWWKLLFTAITLGTGFKGGEVTPLFFIGATLGNALAVLTGAPVDLMAGLGFIAVFAGATNTPVACTLMGVELFGGNNILYYAIACFMAYYFSGKSGIYSSQKMSVNKASHE